MRVRRKKTLAIKLINNKKNRKKTIKKFDNGQIDFNAQILSSKPTSTTFLDKKKMKQHIHKKNYYIRQAGLIYIR